MRLRGKKRGEWGHQRRGNIKKQKKKTAKKNPKNEKHKTQQTTKQKTKKTLLLLLRSSNNKGFKKTSCWNSFLKLSVHLRYFWQPVTENPKSSGIPNQGKPSFHLSSNHERFYDCESGKLTLLPGSQVLSISCCLCCPHSTRDLHYGSKMAAEVLRVKASLWCPEAHSGAVSNHVCLFIDETDYCQKPPSRFTHPLIPELLPELMPKRENKRAMAVDLN